MILIMVTRKGLEMKKLISVVCIISCFFSLSCGIISCSSLEKSTDIEMEDILFNEIDSTESGWYHAVGYDKDYLIKKTVYHSDGKTSVIPSFDTKIEYYQYSEGSLSQVEDAMLPEDKEHFYPYYTNPSHELYYWDGLGSLLKGNADHSFTDFYDVFGPMIAKGSSQPWVLFDHTQVVPHEYILYNLDDHTHHIINFESQIQQCYFYPEVLILAYELENDPWNIHYNAYFGETSNAQKNEKTTIESEPEGTSWLDMFEHSFLHLPSNTEFLSYNPDTLELLWMTPEKNQINITDISTGNLKETLLDKEIFSQVLPFQTEQGNGVWAVPALTSVGMSDHIYCIGWKENSISVQTCLIGTFSFDQNAFVDKETGQLYIIVTDATSTSTPSYHLLSVEPWDTEKVTQYPITFTGTFFEKREGSYQFKKLASLPGQLLLQAKYNAYSPYQGAAIFLVHLKQVKINKHSAKK